ncbi:Histone-Lysine N-Methyltransferase ash1l [Rhizophlyctis rosea]|nr:Histone-Lysine N-Methyltransferase ash1l [Rhizophlyctis rosea]
MPEPDNSSRRSVRLAKHTCVQDATSQMSPEREASPSGSQATSTADSAIEILSDRADDFCDKSDPIVPDDHAKPTTHLISAEAEPHEDPERLTRSVPNVGARATTTDSFSTSTRSISLAENSTEVKASTEAAHGSRDQIQDFVGASVLDSLTGHAISDVASGDITAEDARRSGIDAESGRTRKLMGAGLRDSWMGEGGEVLGEEQESTEPPRKRLRTRKPGIDYRENKRQPVVTPAAIPAPPPKIFSQSKTPRSHKTIPPPKVVPPSRNARSSKKALPPPPNRKIAKNLRARQSKAPLAPPPPPPEPIRRVWGKLARDTETVWDGDGDVKELYQKKSYLTAGLFSRTYKTSKPPNPKLRMISTDGFKFPLPVHGGEKQWEEKDFELPYDLQLFVQQAGGAQELRRKMDTSGPTPFTKIPKNVFVERKPRKAKEWPVCQCEMPPNGKMGCGESCLNRCMFIECSPKDCPLGDKCSNQSFQRREFVPNLQVYRTARSGFGLRTKNAIPQNTLVIEYRGEIITHKQCIERMESVYKGLENYYFLEYSTGEVIDACRKGTDARFINHSCEPNCHIEKWSVDGEYRVGIFATENIPEGGDLTYDYRFESFGPAQSCFCGSKNCRGRIGKSGNGEDDGDAKGGEQLLLDAFSNRRRERNSDTYPFHLSPATTKKPSKAPTNDKKRKKPTNAKKASRFTEQDDRNFWLRKQARERMTASFREVMKNRAYFRDARIFLVRNFRKRMEAVLAGEAVGGSGRVVEDVKGKGKEKVVETKDDVVVKGKKGKRKGKGKKGKGRKRTEGLVLEGIAQRLWEDVRRREAEEEQEAASAEGEVEVIEISDEMVEDSVDSDLRAAVEDAKGREGDAKAVAESLGWGDDVPAETLVDVLPVRRSGRLSGGGGTSLDVFGMAGPSSLVVKSGRGVVPAKVTGTVEGEGGKIVPAKREGESVDDGTSKRGRVSVDGLGDYVAENKENGAGQEGLRRGGRKKVNS